MKVLIYFFVMVSFFVTMTLVVSSSSSNQKVYPTKEDLIEKQDIAAIAYANAHKHDHENKVAYPGATARSRELHEFSDQKEKESLETHEKHYQGKQQSRWPPQPFH